MEKLVVVIMGQNCERFIDMAYESVKDADAIMFCDGGSNDGTVDYLKSQGFTWEPNAIGRKTMIFNDYKQHDKQMNGKQRNFYLKMIKKKYPDYWCLAIDADEVVENITKIKEFIQIAKKGIYSIKMRHFIGDLGHEDATQEIHPVLNRLFKIEEAVDYPEVEHPVLRGNNISMSLFIGTTIWHLAYIPNMWEIRKRYENHLAKSNMHTPEFLSWWYKSHLFGTYPRKPFNPEEIPNIIINKFGIDPEEFYFENRKTVEFKHIMDAIYLRDWLSKKIKNPKVIEFGCGIGLRIWAMNMVKLDAYGNEISKYAVKNNIYSSKIKQGDITKGLTKIDKSTFDLSMAYDVLEHIEYSDLNKAIDTLIKNTKKYILVSIPFKGTHNCNADKTHIIKEDRDWWVKQFKDKGLKLIKTPDHFLFKEQILIFQK